jgi:hypothetical protein
MQVTLTPLDDFIQQGATLCYTPQNVVEFWNVFTRPRNKNGFGLTSAKAASADFLTRAPVHVLAQQ